MMEAVEVAPADLAAKEERLVERLEGLERVVVAYSGGVDSALLAAIAHEALGDGALAVTAVSPSLARRERDAAASLARSMGWHHREVTTHEIEREDYVRNSSDRCYWCKTELFEVLEPLAARRRSTIAVGTNLDDLSDHRPGLAAASQRAIATPLADAGLTKKDVRTLSAARGLPVADKPAAPCLASRMAYGVRVTPASLARIDEAEEVMRELGFAELRVRDHGDLARVEVPRSTIERAAAASEVIAARLKDLGFTYVTLDLQGLRSGSLNEVLAPPRIKPR